MGKARGDDKTGDLFSVQEMFPVQAPDTLRRALDYNRTVSGAMAEAIRECGKTRELICAEMTEILGYEDRAVTVAQLNAYTSAAREDHTISLVRFKAFVRATGCVWLWDVALEGEGLTLLQGEEALHAQASLAEKHGRELLAEADRIRNQAPLQVRRRRVPK